MGVLGLTPFLQKACPEVIKKLPNRLRELTGKTIVIDGTLITQRLHFAHVPHKYRHVLGWYRLIHEFKDSDVRPICVFDGKERSVAKADEVERRRHVRRVDAFRGTIESERLDRLSSLTNLLKTLDPQERHTATVTLKDILSESPEPSPATSSPLYVAGELDDVGTTLPVDTGRPRTSISAIPYDDVLGDGDFDDSDIREVLMNSHGDVNFAQKIARTSPTQSVDDIPIDQLSLDSYNIIQPVATEDEQNAAEASPCPPVRLDEEFPSSMAALYLNYRHSVLKLDNLPLSGLLSLSSPDKNASSTLEEAFDVRTEAVISKTQYQLTLAEGKLWERLAASDGIEEDSTTTELALLDLAEKSSLISQSYTRRNNPPTEETYAESRALLQAMGVPCLETTGPYEAEALASSLVVNGLADYVASEDTDVLVYEAPLLRNITSRRDPLMLISGAEVRAALQLERDGFVDFALLLGTDFSQRIKNVGPQRALKFIREHGSIEQILEREKQYPPRQTPETYMEHVRTARATFTTLPPVPEQALLESGGYQDEEVANLMTRFKLWRYIEHDGSVSASALDGNYFNDNPTAF
ncbi:PIN domain-like protein [Auriscalpium vulgare]|uniref:PIN domain-like protein n=1 Tax=Auriscalpium vulgare TaxID=40419 RepID=A0ACB8RLG3_9AGAM|nr:PIN domain-like protein [Auriscalpium vulgare]